MLGSPVLLGAVTTLVVMVAVLLAYNANSGLPFVPSRQVSVDVANGEELVPGNEVREGGRRIGLITGMTPARLPGGSVGGRLSLKLDKAVGDIPPDTRFVIRPGSILGLKYLDYVKGRAPGNVPDGHVFGPGHATASLDLDRLLGIFDRRTRAGSREVIRGSGDALAGRGPDINELISLLPPTLGRLEPVMRTLGTPRTDLARLFRALDRVARELAPVAGPTAHLFTTMANTFAAISHDPRALEDTIAKSPPTLEVSTRSLAVQRPFLRHLAAFSVDLRGAAAELRPALPPLADALEAGPPVLRDSVALDARLANVLDTVRSVTSDPATNIALRGLTATVGTLGPQLRYLGPYQTVCDYWTYFWTDVSDHLSETDPRGTAERALLNSAGNQDNGLSNMGAAVAANGENYSEQSRPRGDPQHLHGQPYPAAIDPNGRADCESAQRGYLRRYAQGVPRRFLIAVNPRSPGNQGPTYAGRRRVPLGETFANVPENHRELNRPERP